MTFTRGLTYAGFGWCALLLAAPPLRGFAPGVIVSLFILEVAFVLSVRSLFVNGRVSVALGLMQLALFAVVPSQVVASLGPRHYDAEPSMAGWAGFAAAHTARAADILDALEESGARLQRVHHQSTLAAVLIIGLHLTVDLMVLGAAVAWARKRWGGARAFRAATRGYVEAAFGLCLVGWFWVAWLQGWRPADWFLWPLDNVLRVIDVGDAMQVFGWRLHAVEPSVGLAAYALVFRLAAALVLAEFFAYLRVSLFRGFGMTVDDYVELLDRSNQMARLAAIEALAALPPDQVVPRMLAAAADPRRASGPRFVLDRMGPRLGRFVPELLDAMRSPQQGVREAAAAGLSGARAHATDAIPELIAMLSDARLREPACATLDAIDPDWPSWPGTHAVVPHLIAMIRPESLVDLGRLCKALSAIEPSWPLRPEARAAAERLIALLIPTSALSVVGVLPAFGPAARPAAAPLLRLLGSGGIPPALAGVALDAIRPGWRSLSAVRRLRDLLFARASIGPLTAGGSWEAAALDVIDPRWPEAVDGSGWKRELLTLVLSADARDRSTAYRVIERFGKAVADLAEPLAGVARSDPDPDRRRAAADALSRLAKWKPNACLPVMLTLLRGDPADVAIAFRGLAEMAEHAGPGVPAITRFLDNPQAPRPLVVAAIEILGALGPAARSAVPSLAVLSESSYLDVRAAARFALREIDGEALAWLDADEVSA